MKVYIATDHAGFALAQALSACAAGLGHDVENCGAYTFDASDDFTDFISRAGRKLAADAAARVESRAIVLGGSGQGEAMLMNRFKGVRCALYYGEAGNQIDASGKSLDMLASTRMHNDANALSLGARFLNEEAAKAAVTRFLGTPFSGEERHARRIAKLDTA